MTDTDKLIADFQALSLEDKKKKVKNIIEKSHLKKLDTIFISIDQAIDNNNPNVNDSLLTDIYSRIMKLWGDLTKISQEKKMKEFTAIHDKMQKMREREKKEREEESVDSFLDDSLNKI